MAAFQRFFQEKRTMQILAVKVRPAHAVYRCNNYPEVLCQKAGLTFARLYKRCPRPGVQNFYTAIHPPHLRCAKENEGRKKLRKKNFISLMQELLFGQQKRYMLSHKTFLQKQHDFPN